MSDLVEFLRAQLDADERIAQESIPDEGDGEWGYIEEWDRVSTEHEDLYPLFDGEHIARHDPARALREVAAKRAILDAAVNVMGGPDYEDCIVKPLASVYAGADGWREEWA